MASNAWIMWENILPDADVVTESVAADDGWPLTNATENWNPGTAYRYQLPGSTVANNDFDFGAGVTKEPDTVVGAAYTIAGGTGRPIRLVQYSDNGIAWTNAVAATGWESTLPFASSRSWTGKGAHQYWRIRHTGFANRQIGILTLGRKFEISIGGLPANFEPFPQRVHTERLMSHSGYPLASNVTAIENRFTFDVSNPGLGVTDFFEPASGLTWADFLAHAQGLSKPFWFCWNPGEDYTQQHFTESVYLCRLVSAPTPIEWTTARRGLTMTLAAYNRAA